ncbi:ABC transporter substrate-binding protein [Candidatus Dependentiae bacterium]|nr:ABC transporter substrate-binding protein [Candidatus Dependentiae bacterium]
MHKKIKLYNFLIIICLLYFLNIFSFNSLEDIKQYAQQNIEYPTIDNNDYSFPDYSSFYKKSDEHIFLKIFNDLLFLLDIKKPLWSTDQFKNLIIKINKNRKQKKKQGDFIVKFSPTQSVNFVIWGNLQGAFHSLVRDLEELKKLKILDNNLKIAPNYYFVFNGNVIGKSPYILDTLTIILKLMEINPESVFYIKGIYETKKNWKNYGLKKELNLKINKEVSNKTPLRKEINNFLNTLPLALYIKLENSNKAEYIRISNYDRNYPKLEENKFANFLNSKAKTTIEQFNLNKQTNSTNTVNISVIIKNESNFFTYQRTDGLEHLYPDKGSTAWSIFSSPTLSNQKLYNFTNDAFAILKIKPKKDPIINLYKQNTLKKTGFIIKSYNLLTEALIEKKVSPEKIKKEEITIGTIMDLSAELSDLCKSLLEGLYLRINEENQKGGINGKRINLIHYDDKYNPSLTKQYLKDFIDKGIKIILSPSGSHQLEACLPIIKTEDVGIFFPDANSPIFQQPDLKNIVNLLDSSYQDAQVLTKHLINDLKINKIALFYQNEPFSEGAFAGAKSILEKYGLKENKDWIATSHLAHTIKVSNAIEKIKEFNPRAIILLSVAKPTKTLLDGLGLNFLFNKKLLGVVSYSTKEFLQFLEKRNLQMIYNQHYPDPKTSNLEIIKQYKNAAAKNNLPIDKFVLEGYIAADLFIYLMQKISGKITKEKLINEAEKIKNYNHKGILFNFNPETRSLATTIWINSENNQTIPKKIYQLPKEKTKIEKPVSGKLKIGSTLDLSSKSSEIGRGLLDGIDLKINEVNKHGGINKQIIKFNYKDDKYNPSITKKNILEFLKGNIKIILSSTGSYSFKEAIPFIKNDKISVFFQNANAPIFFDPNLKNIINFSPSSFYEGQVLAEYLCEKIKAQKIAIFYQKDPYGEGVINGAEEVFIKNNLLENQNWIKISHYPNKDFNPKAINDIKLFKPDAILLLSYFEPSQKLLRSLGTTFLFNTLVLATDTCSGPEFRRYIQEKNIRFAYVQTMPPLNSKKKIVTEYKNTVTETGEQPNQFGLKGYIITSIFVDLLKKINPPITREKIIAEAENLNNYNFKGLNLTFEPASRNIYHSFWLISEDGKIFEKKIQEKKSKPKQEKKETTQTKIEIGTLIDFTGELADLGKSMLTGLHLAIDKKNKSGGIKGKKIQLTALDNKYNPDIAKNNMEKLIKQGIDIILNLQGSYVLQACIPLIKENKNIILFPSARAPIFHDSSKYPNIFHLFAPSNTDGKFLAKYIIEEEGFKKIALFYQTEPFSEGALKGVKEVIYQNNLQEGKDWISVSYLPQQTLNFEKIAQQITKFSPKALLFLSFPRPTEALIKKLGLNFLYDTKFLQSQHIQEMILNNLCLQENLILHVPKLFQILKQ